MSQTELTERTVWGSVRTGGQADSNMARLVQLAALLVSVRALQGAAEERAGGGGGAGGADLLVVNVTSSLSAGNNNNTSDEHYQPAALPPSLPNLEIIPFVAADAVHEDTQPPDSAAPLDRPPSPVTDLFSPPVNTEGGFVPKGPDVSVVSVESDVSVASVVSDVSDVYYTTMTEPPVTPPAPHSPPEFSLGGVLQLLLGGSDDSAGTTTAPDTPATTTTTTTTTTSITAGGSLPALGGCNIYGRTYSLQQPVPELSSSCRACSCTSQGLTCRAAPDCLPAQHTQHTQHTQHA